MIGKDFGQHEPLTTRLHNLVRSYPKGLGIFKEFIQNADDAEAKEIVFVIDEQQYNIKGMPENMKWLHTTPALLVYNNKPFKEEDIQDIQKIGESGKSDSVGKTGRFGLGFNACYNVTDVPYFLTGKSIYFFDPHRQTIYLESSESAGRSFEVSEVEKAGWPLRDAFCHFINEKFQYNGTVFRLPFRTDEQAKKSKIKKDVYTIEDAFNAVDELVKMGSAILLFLKHVKNLKVEHRTRDGHVTELFIIEAKNLSEIKKSREKVNALLSDPDISSILSYLANNGDEYSVCDHVYNVVHKDQKSTEKWRVVDGFYIDDELSVLEACKKMIKNEEKALPYAGVAWPIKMDRLPSGRIYCFLPVPVHTTMPVQLNGYFDLDDSRQNLFLDLSAHGSAGIRVDWNKILLEVCVVKAYICLLESLRTDFDSNKIESFYKVFPNVVDDSNSWEGWLTSKFYLQASTAEIIRVSGNKAWCELANTRSLPLQLQSLEHVLINENTIPIPEPSIPDNVKDGFNRNQIVVPELTPAELRTQLKEQKDVDCSITAAPRACLKKLDYIKRILSFCLSDSPGEDIIGLPLVVDLRKKLRTVGLTKYPLYLIGNTLDLQIFKEYPEWFVDPDFAVNTDLEEVEEAKIYLLDNKRFVRKLSDYVSAYSENGEIRFITGRSKPFTDSWLQAVFKRLLESDLDKVKVVLENIPLIPDQSRVLHNMGSASTPLLFKEKNKKLKEALIELSVPLVTGISEKLFQLLIKFSEEKEGFIWQVNPLDLIDTLFERCANVVQERDQFTEIQKALLDYFSKEESLELLKEDNGRCYNLKTLKLFPTVNGDLVNLTRKAYIAQDFKFPNVSFDADMLDDGPRGRWRELYLLYEIPQLSRSKLIDDVIIPSFEQLDDKEKLNTTIWLRDNLNIASGELNADQSDELLEKVREAPIIVCEDGAKHAPKDVYQPESDLVREVLGDHAPFPDMNKIYSEQNKQWLIFFKQLNMPTEPRLNDVVEYVGAITDKDIPVDQKAASLKTVYLFIKDHVEKAIEQGESIPEELSEALESLADMDWIPVRQEGYDLLCFKKPGVFFARPGEVYFPREGQLVASQAYIATTLKEPIQRVRKEMGLPEKPPVKLVVRHFKEILSLCSSQEAMPSESDLVKALSQIYRYFGTEVPGEEDESEEAIKDKGDNETVDLKASFSGTPCIYVKEKKYFWRPAHVFRENVSYMEPWRKTIRNKDGYIERGITLLGRREEPELDDWNQVLEEISKGVDSIEQDRVTKVIRELLRRIVEELSNKDDIDNNVLVPIQQGKMLPAGSVFIGDAPWYDSVLASCDIPILSSSVSDIWAITRRLGIFSLAKSIEQDLVEDPVESELKDNLRECLRLENLLQSDEFIFALERLIRHEDNALSQKGLFYLYDIKVRCVKIIKTHLYLYYQGAKRFLSNYDADYYWDNETKVAMLTENRSKYFHEDLAALLNRSLGDTSLKDLAPLVKIFQCEPNEISEVLDDLRIRKYTIENVDEYEDDAEVEPQVYLDDYSEFADYGEGDMIGELTELSNNDIDDLKPDLEKHAAEVKEKSATSESFKQEEQAIEPHGTSTASRPKSTTESKNITEPFKDQASSSLPGINTPHSQWSRGEIQDSKNQSDKEGEQPEEKIDSPKESIPSKRQPGRQQRLLSYVSYGTHNDNIDHDGHEKNDQGFRIGQKAVQIVIEDEKRNGGKVRAMPHNNPGFDVISESDSEIRYIEVKGTEEVWGERGVTLTATQFFYAKENQNQNYWLYVVENVFSEKPQIYKIQNPIDKVDSFSFDCGWIQAAEYVEEKDDKMPNPKPGDEVIENGDVVGIVASVTTGKLPLVIYKAKDGKMHRKLLPEITFHPKENE